MVARIRSFDNLYLILYYRKSECLSSYFQPREPQKKRSIIHLSEVAFRWRRLVCRFCVHTTPIYAINMRVPSTGIHSSIEHIQMSCMCPRIAYRLGFITFEKDDIWENLWNLILRLHLFARVEIDLFSALSYRVEFMPSFSPKKDYQIHTIYIAFGFGPTMNYTHGYVFEHQLRCANHSSNNNKWALAEWTLNIMP